MDASIENLLGLNRSSSNEEIRDRAFACALEAGSLIVSTLSADGHSPRSRPLDLHRLDDEGNLYLAVSQGKRVHTELMKNPPLACAGVCPLEGTRGLSVRIEAEAEPVSDFRYINRYWRQNPEARALYRQDLGSVRIFRLARGCGELFLTDGERSALRFRFGFGGVQPRPWRYRISEDCIGCGVCAGQCTMSVIGLIDGVSVIDHSGCIECGRCYASCPYGAIRMG